MNVRRVRCRFPAGEPRSRWLVLAIAFTFAGCSTGPGESSTTGQDDYRDGGGSRLDAAPTDSIATDTPLEGSALDLVDAGSLLDHSGESSGPPLVDAGDSVEPGKDASSIEPPEISFVHCDLELGETNTLMGSYTIENQLDLEALQGFTEITGHLLLRAQGLEVIELPNLRRIGGDLRTGNSNGSLQELVLPQLETVGGRVELEFMRNLVSVDLPCLVSSGTIEFERIVSLTELRLPMYQAVVGEESNFLMADNAVLESAEFPLLQVIGENLLIERNSELSRIDFDELVFVGGVMTAYENHSLSPCLIRDVLEQLRDNGFIGDVDIRDNGPEPDGPCP